MFIHFILTQVNDAPREACGIFLVSHETELETDRKY
jgi:hypothetical protein